MTPARIFLLLNALVWLPYGVYCLFQPGILAEVAGVASASATGTTELRAMYGGLQIAIGGLCLAGFAHEPLRRGALTTLAFLTVGLGSARALGLLLDASGSAYTLFAVVLEAAIASVAAWLASRPLERAA